MSLILKIRVVSFVNYMNYGSQAPAHVGQTINPKATFKITGVFTTLASNIVYVVHFT